MQQSQNPKGTAGREACSTFQLLSGENPDLWFWFGGNAHVSLPAPGGDLHLFPSHSEPWHSHHLDTFISSEAAGLRLLADCSSWLPFGAHPGQVENNHLRLHFLQRSQEDELPPLKNKLIMAQKRWTRTLEGEEVAPLLHLCCWRIEDDVPSTFLEDTGMQSQQKKGAVWHRCPAAEMLP